jgi:outer membrane lipoprotein-sorting protein
MLGAVKTPGIVRRHPELRWLTSIALIVAAGVLVSTSVSGVFRADSALPVTSPAQLVDDLRTPHVGGYSGTIDAQVDLGLPRRIGAAFALAAPAGTLLRGSHRLRYWYGDADHQRVAVVSDTSEQDTFRNGTQLWQWDTATGVAQHRTVPSDADAALPLALQSSAALAPPQLAVQLVNLLGKSSDMALRSGDPVAGRPTYQLVLTPDTAASRIAEIDIDVDGRQGVPLRVRIYPLDGTQAALDVSFEDDITFETPDSRNFEFTPPTGAQVRSGSAVGSYSAVLNEVAMVGTGWRTVASYRSGLATGRNLAHIARTLLTSAAHRVKGNWGRGRLLVTPILTVLITTQGQVLAGPVTPTVLYGLVE